MARKTSNGYRLAEALNPSIGTTSNIIETCSLICRAATTHARLAEADCNYGLTERENRLVERLEKRIANLCLELPTVVDKAITPIFSGDPRGATVKLVLPDGRTDDWGQTGICVPTS